MSASPHQPESLAAKITRLKADLAEKIALRSQIQTLGQSNSGGGTATTYSNLDQLNREIEWLEAKIAAFVDQLNGDTANLQPGMVLGSHRSEYC